MRVIIWNQNNLDKDKLIKLNKEYSELKPVVDSINQYNTSSFNQSYTQSIIGLSGSVIEIHDSQEEFYNGEYSGSYALVTTQSLNAANTYK